MLDFASLNKDYGGESWCDTFAYWLLMLHYTQSTYAKNAPEACAIMSFQYDVEDQVHNSEMLIGNPELVPSVFTPIAPVTLAYKWSPFPTAIEVLGKPLHVDTHRGKTLAVFEAKQYSTTISSTLDENHFDFLLKYACNHASTSNSSILLVGSPGWDYNSDGYLEEAPEIQALMRNFGFIYTLRKPAST